jgi:hypothetical protein
MDASGSMQRFKKTVMEASNRFLAEIQKGIPADRASVLSLSFNEELVPLADHVRLADCRPIDRFFAHFGTRLYGVLREVLGELLPQVQAAAGRLNVVLATFTDGDDIDSRPEDLPAVRALSLELLMQGAELRLVGIGVDAKKMSVAMGWPRDQALNVEPTDEGVRSSLGDVSRTTSLSLARHLGGTVN